MTIRTILKWEDFTYYVDIPCVDEKIHEVDFYQMTEEERDLLVEHFVVPMYYVCGALIDDGDVEFYDPERCKKMSAWLEEQIPIVDNPTLKGIYERINYACHKSIELNTGFVMDL